MENRPASTLPVRLLAGVDIGTLTCRLLIARVHPPHQLEVVRSDRRILRLGQDVQQNKRLLPEAMDRVIRTLAEWRLVIDPLRPEGETAVATSAVRDAENREEFLARVRSETGFDVEIITGEEEARRTLLGICAGLPVGVNDFLGLDIGGGSTEFIVNRVGQPASVQSVNVGVVRLTEMTLRSDPLTVGDVGQARQIVRNHMAAVRPSLGALTGLALVGTAGSVTSLAAMAQRLTSYDPARVHHYRLSLDTVRGLESEFLGRTRVERRGLYGLEPGREDVIVAGTLILREVMEALGYQECVVSDYGLREGVVIDLARRVTS